jgi:hypothetical protein
VVFLAISFGGEGGHSCMEQGSEAYSVYFHIVPNIPISAEIVRRWQYIVFLNLSLILTLYMPPSSIALLIAVVSVWMPLFQAAMHMSVECSKLI